MDADCCNCTLDFELIELQVFFCFVHCVVVLLYCDIVVFIFIFLVFHNSISLAFEPVGAVTQQQLQPLHS